MLSILKKINNYINYYFRCYTNTRVVANNSKSSSDSSSSTPDKTIIKTIKKEALENGVSESDESIEEIKLKSTDSTPVKVENIPDSTKTNVPNSSQDNQPVPTLKTEWNGDNASQISSDDQSSSSAQCLPKYSTKEHKSARLKYVCVICDERFSNKCLLTIHQVQHIKSDRSSYGVFMAALARSA